MISPSDFCLDHVQQLAGVDEFERGIADFTNRRIEPAIRHFQNAEQLSCNPDECAAYRWACWMLLGYFEHAWQESDAIDARSRSDSHQLWDGKPFNGNRVLIRCLHGFGDAIQFLRFARLVGNTAAAVIVETHPEMVSLIETLPFVNRVVTWACGPPLNRGDWDQQIEVMELPKAFRTLIGTVPPVAPSFSLSPQALEKSDRQLGPRHQPRIGILWSSSQWNPARSLPLCALMPVLSRSHFSFYSFQRGPARREAESLPRRITLHDTALHSPEIVDTAADLSNMDLLITVDTMAAHLAGTLGKPVWTLLPWAADWRWMLNRDDTPWYPTMTLFRQPAPDDWTPVVENVCARLDSMHW